MNNTTLCVLGVIGVNGLNLSGITSNPHFWTIAIALSTICVQWINSRVQNQLLKNKLLEQQINKNGDY